MEVGGGGYRPPGAQEVITHLRERPGPSYPEIWGEISRSYRKNGD